MKQRSEDAKPFNKSFADRVWNGRLFARAYALINEGYHKIKWKVSNKTPVAMYVDSEPVPSVFENTHTDPPHLCASRYVNESSG